jgi:hypothetical protein
MVRGRYPYDFRDVRSQRNGSPYDGEDNLQAVSPIGMARNNSALPKSKVMS